uniref:SDR family NAD(P)-dependent oxidoreductase n=1 Tax=Heterorhabditis bacteriophora TaxID=37862 RepID=A0A1I7XN63_HETBA
MGRFDNKVVIVTGSSNGIGRTTAILFAEEGAKVTITGRSEKALDITRDELLKAGAKADDIHYMTGDLTNESVQKKLIESTVEKFGQIDILVRLIFKT